MCLYILECIFSKCNERKDNKTAKLAIQIGEDAIRLKILTKQG